MAIAAVEAQNQQLHLRLTEKDWVECFTQLKYAELGVFFFIRTLDPFGDRDLQINIREIAEKLKLHRTSVSRALIKLEKLQFISMEIEAAIVRHKVANQRLTLLKPEAKPSKAEKKQEKQRCASTHRGERTRTGVSVHAPRCALMHKKVRPRTSPYILIARAIKLLQTKFKLFHTSPLPLSQGNGEKRGGRKNEAKKQNRSRYQPVVNEAKFNSPLSQAKQDLSSQADNQTELNIPVAQVEVVPTSGGFVKTDPFFGNFRGGLAYNKAIADGGLPEGPWTVIDSKGLKDVDEAFVDWWAGQLSKSKEYDKNYARYVARASWRNNPEKIRDAWNCYHDWFVTVVVNISSRQESGCSIPDEERAKLEPHGKAVVDSRGEMSLPFEAKETLKLSRRSPEEILGAWSQLQFTPLPAEPNWDVIAKQAEDTEQEYLSEDASVALQPASTPEIEPTHSQPSLDAPVAPSELVDKIKALATAREAQQRAKARAIAEADGELTPDKLYRLNKQLVNSKTRKDLVAQAKAERFANSDEYCCERDADGLICEIWEVCDF